MPCKHTVSTYEFFKLYPDEKAAILYLENRRWNSGTVCPLCSGNRTSRQKDYRYHQCKDCRGKFTVRTGTIFERSHISLEKWLYAMYLLQTERKGISSLQLSRELGITQKSAWFMLHRLREACGIEAMKLTGVIEVDETCIGGKEKNKHNSKKLKAGRGAVGKQAIIGAKERGATVRAQVIDSTDGATLKGFVHEVVKVGSTVYTDEHKGYHDLGGLFYRHGTVKHSAKEYVNGAHTNGIESVWAVLKRGYNGTFHHISTKHLQRYVDEFTFRLNEGDVKRHTLERIDSLVDQAIGKRLTYKELTT